MRSIVSVVAVVLFALVGVFASATPSAAVTIFCQEIGGETCSGTLDYNAGTGVLEVHITADLGNTGFFTAIGIETPGDATATGLNAGSTTGWTLAPGAAGLNDFDIVVADTSPGNANAIDAGETLDLFIQLAGTNIGSLTADDFVDVSNQTGNCGGIQGTWGCIHDQGTGPLGEGSLKLPLKAEGDSVPEPGTILLLGAGLVGLGVLSRRRSHGK